MQSIFIYFVMAFPTTIVAAFFLVLIFKNHVLYAPSDFNDERHFLSINKLNKTIEKEAEKVLKETGKFSVEEIKKHTEELKVAIFKSSLSEKILRYMKERPREAFSAKALSYIFAVTRTSIVSSLAELEEQRLVQSGSEPSSRLKLWQISEKT
jgi:ribosomal protein RSM22 (predicted rRNA methylase)